MYSTISSMIKQVDKLVKISLLSCFFLNISHSQDLNSIQNKFQIKPEDLFEIYDKPQIDSVLFYNYLYSKASKPKEGDNREIYLGGIDILIACVLYVRSSDSKVYRTYCYPIVDHRKVDSAQMDLYYHAIDKIHEVSKNWVTLPILYDTRYYSEKDSLHYSELNRKILAGDKSVPRPPRDGKEINIIFNFAYPGGASHESYAPDMLFWNVQFVYKKEE